MKPEYKRLLLELKEMRKVSDYNTKEKFVFPYKTNQGTLYVTPRLVATMEKFLNANHNQLTP